ncbi:MAG: efflux RND transporter periplasmic adaptor subunit [Hydrococcus sp. C42_A2020_068]|nr:efflux RND transporter periplasmic adaptor subunit [Hydrococcus sp. C42_A2020_068]
MTRILLVDDQALLCEVLQTWLEAEEDFQVVGRADNGETAIAQVEKLEPDIVLMDIEMPKMNGITATQIISERFPRTKVLVLSAFEDEAYLVQSLQAGAQGYLLKNTQAAELAHTIRFVDRGHNQIDPRLLKKIVTQVPIATEVAARSLPESALLHQPQKSAPEMLLEVEGRDVRGGTAVELLNLPSYQEFIPEPTSPLPNSKRESSDNHHTLNQKKNIWEAFRVEKLTKNQKINAFALLGCVAILLMLGSSIFPRNREARAPEPKQPRSTSILPVKAIAVEPVNSYRESRFYTGTVTARRTSELGFELSGQLTRIVVDEGSRVKAGTPLAYLDSQRLETSRRELLARRAQAVAQLKEMQAGSRPEIIAAVRALVRDLSQQLELARQKSQRREMLYTEGAISREQRDEALNEQAVLQARRERAQSQLDELLAGTRPERIEAQQSLIQQYDAIIARIQLQLQKNILKAPFSATVSRRLADEGTVVSAGQAVLRLVENKAPEVRIGVPATVAARISPGSHQQLQIGQKNYQAKVSSILPEIDASTRTLTVVLTLDESIGTEVSPGQIARLKLDEIVRDSGYWLPITALVKGTRGLWSCYVLSEPVKSEDGNAFLVERRDVEVLHTESDRVLVRGTLQSGDRVILSGTHRLVPGQLVRSLP